MAKDNDPLVSLMCSLLKYKDVAFEAVQQSQVASRLCELDDSDIGRVGYHVNLLVQPIAICLADPDGEYEWVWVTYDNTKGHSDSYAVACEAMAAHLKSKGFQFSAGPKQDPFTAGQLDLFSALYMSPFSEVYSTAYAALVAVGYDLDY